MSNSRDSKGSFQGAHPNGSAVETSCDESAAAVVRDSARCWPAPCRPQMEEARAQRGGVVAEIALPAPRRTPARS